MVLVLSFTIFSLLRSPAPIKTVHTRFPLIAPSHLNAYFPLHNLCPGTRKSFVCRNLDCHLGVFGQAAEDLGLVLKEKVTEIS